MFVMDTYYACTAALVVPNEKWQQFTLAQKAKTYIAKLGSNVMTAWQRLTGKKA
jgi:hypothetical protein